MSLIVFLNFSRTYYFDRFLDIKVKIFMINNIFVNLFLDAMIKWLNKIIIDIYQKDFFEYFLKYRLYFL